MTCRPANSKIGPTTFIVDTLSDNPADGNTLREAVESAHANPADNSIEFADGLAGTITMLGGTEMSITDNVSIVGPGPEVITVDAGDASRHFDSTTVGIELTISSPRATTPAPCAGTRRVRCTSPPTSGLHPSLRDGDDRTLCPHRAPGFSPRNR